MYLKRMVEICLDFGLKNNEGFTPLSLIESRPDTEKYERVKKILREHKPIMQKSAAFKWTVRLMIALVVYGLL